MLTDGRTRPVATFNAYADVPARAPAATMARKTRVHFLLPRHQANPANDKPTTKCAGQSVPRVTLRRSTVMFFQTWLFCHACTGASSENANTTSKTPSAIAISQTQNGCDRFMPNSADGFQQTDAIAQSALCNAWETIVCVSLKTDESAPVIGLVLFCSLRGRSSAEKPQW